MTAAGNKLPADWTIGIGRLGPPPAERHDSPQHWLTQTLRYDNDRVVRHVSADHYITAAEAQKDMKRRMREVGQRFICGPGWMERRHESEHPELRCWGRLEWTDAQPEDTP